MKVNSIISAVFVVLACFAQVQAQSDHTFVSSHGVDNASCGPLDAPCRSFNVALPKTNAAGEIIALDSGVYDNFNVVISQSVTLAAAPGVHVELSNGIIEGDRLTINASTSDTVVLRNLYIGKQGNGGAVNGIKVKGVGTLHIENCVISGFETGISFDLTAAAQVFIQDTIVRNSVADGILFSSSSGFIKASVDHCRFENNGTSGVYNGVNILQRAKVIARDTIASGNGSAGFNVSGGDLSLEHCEASNNKHGIVVSDFFGAANALVSNSIVTNNSQNGFSQIGGGVFHSLGNNTVRRNGLNTSGTITVVSGT